jgi:hypothetical protein
MEPEPRKTVVVSEWTVDTLKELMDERDRRYELMASTAKEAVTLFRLNNDKHQSIQNEWRQAMTDKDRSFVTKPALWGYAVGIVGLILSLILIIEKIRL